MRVLPDEAPAKDHQLLLGIQELQRWTTNLLALHRRHVAANKLLPRATAQQRELALRARTDKELFDAVRDASEATVKRYETRAASAFHEAHTRGVSIWTLVEERSGNVDSWYTFKAGVQRFLAEEMLRTKRSLDKWQRDRKAKRRPSRVSNAEARQLVQRLLALGKALHSTPTEPPERFGGDGKSKRYAKQSKVSER